ncbi:hypothetical protein K438DRAFT_1926902 [Mycena galopus ATCC 62051]|nr:hypothetical protein K438DRAFT_1926902 [Mycena galopus ATCC 62051]
MPIQLGSIHHISGAEYENSLEIALSANLKLIDSGWLTEDPNTQDCWNLIKSDEGTSILENGWIRMKSACVTEEYRRCVYSDDVCSKVLVNTIRSCLHLLGPIENLPPGYLFLCPLAEFETDIPGCFAVPDCRAYWSLDPSGAEWLGAEQARTLGLPDINSWVEVWGKYWNSSDYDGICQFHKAKGFDPYSQDVAIELGYPLFQVSCEQNDLFAHYMDYSQHEAVSVDEDPLHSRVG